LGEYFVGTGKRDGGAGKGVVGIWIISTNDFFHQFIVEKSCTLYIKTVVAFVFYIKKGAYVQKL
jgi:hypothetical protein